MAMKLVRQHRRRLLARKILNNMSGKLKYRMQASLTRRISEGVLWGCEVVYMLAISRELRKAA